MAQVTASPEMKNYEDKKDIVTLHNKGWVIMVIFKALREMVQRWDPNIVFLMETKLKMSAMKREKEKAGFVFGLIFPKAQNCGGLAMLWKKEIKLEIMGYAGKFIDAVVINESSDFKWRITVFYGHPETHRRKESWEQLKQTKTNFSFWF